MYYHDLYSVSEKEGMYISVSCGGKNGVIKAWTDRKGIQKGMAHSGHGCLWEWGC